MENQSMKLRSNVSSAALVAGLIEAKGPTQALLELVGAMLLYAQINGTVNRAAITHLTQAHAALGEQALVPDGNANHRQKNKNIL
jgi:sensor domain CHASE-containing protein